MLERFYRDINTLHVGCEKPRAYFVPFNLGQDASLKRESSSRFTCLNGEWDFAYFENVEELDIQSDDFPETVFCPDKMTVPFCWQLRQNKGYDVPNYINQDYPFPVDPPVLPDVIPCGFYRRTVEYIKHTGKKYYLNFEGVSSCFYLWVNGIFIGYSQVSHCTSELEISDALVDGTNSFEVLVIKHCDGSYLEDQDFFRLSGIFRDVYILERDNEHLSDIYIDCNVSDNLQSAIVSISPEICGTQKLLWKIFAPDSSEIMCGDADSDFNISIKSPALWNSENPQLYKLELQCGEEKFAFQLALKKIEIKNRCLLLNGQKIKLRGINRHDSNPETGYAVTTDDMLNDLYILKRANVNTIRTSHYPNDPRFLEMCDQLGFMIIDEADLESHGMGYNYGDWYWDYWSFLSESSDWRDSYIDRAERLFERDKNHGCVIFWSLGNESGCGENHRLMADYIRSRQPKAIIHYENARLEYQERVGKDFTDISDVESRMYASLDYLKEYLDDEKHKKPFFYCEYADSNGTGDIPLHWKNFEEYDNYCGGCIWEFCDHAVNIGTKENPKYRYGGDFGDWPNDGVSCLDGLVYPNRSPRPGYYDMKIAYQPLEISLNKNTLSVTNKRYFENASDLYIEWVTEIDGVKKNCGFFELSAEPRCKQDFTLDCLPNSGLATLTVYIRQKYDTPWAEKGFELGFTQFVLSSAAIKHNTVAANLDVLESRTKIDIVAGNVNYTFDKITGQLLSVQKGEVMLLKEPLSFEIWHGCTCSRRHFLEIWNRARYEQAKQKTYSCNLELNDSSAVITVKLSFAASAMPPAIQGTAKYTFTADGKLNITFSGKVTENAPELPRFGLNVIMPSDFENIKYIGYGPQESYSDKHSAARLSEFCTTVTENYEHYIKPQECSSHYGVRKSSVTNSDGSGLVFADTSERGFCFKALHYDDRQLLDTKHDDELVPLDKTIVSVDYKIHAMNQGLSTLEPERAFNENQFSFSYDVIPV